jgi:hypothetical protein
MIQTTCRHVWIGVDPQGFAALGWKGPPGGCGDDSGDRCACAEGRARGDGCGRGGAELHADQKRSVRQARLVVLTMRAGISRRYLRIDVRVLRHHTTEGLRGSPLTFCDVGSA